MDKINVVTKKCSECDDYTHLEINGKDVLCSDCYDDKINDKIDGFIDCLNYCGKEVIITKEESVCEHCR